MICTFCKFEIADGAAFCMGCGADLPTRTKKKAASRGGGFHWRPVLRWIGGIVVAVSALMGALAFVLVWDSRRGTAVETAAAPQPVASIESIAPPPVESTQSASPPSRPQPSAGTLRLRGGVDAPLRTLAEWSAAVRSKRLSYAANYVTARVSISSIEEIKNATLWLEDCISKSAERSGRAHVADAASRCLSRITWKK